MKTKKTYVLILSTKFPKTHNRAGEETHFIENVIKEIKKHTLRKNYPLWKKRVREINAGRAVLSVRVWTGLPYKSKQFEVFEFTSIGIQKLKIQRAFKEFDASILLSQILIDNFESDVTLEDISKNDGLSLEDFKAWFKPIPTKPMAIIHFTDDFRYKVKDWQIQRIMDNCHAGRHQFIKWVKTGEDSGKRTYVQKEDLEQKEGVHCIFCKIEASEAR